MKIQTERAVMLNGVRLDMSTLEMHRNEVDAGLVEGQKLSIRNDRWREIRSAVVIRAVEMILNDRKWRRAQVWDVVVAAATERLDNPRIFSQMNGDAQQRIVFGVSYLVAKGVKDMAGRKSAITVQAMDGTILGAKPPGMDEINMMDEATMEVTEEEVNAAMEAGAAAGRANGGRLSLEEEAAAAGVPIVKGEGRVARDNVTREKKPAKAFPFCLCGCGKQTLGGRFLPGHDAVLKSRLVNEYRDAIESDDEGGAKAAHDKLIDLGWEKYATPRPTAKKKVKVDDGLGVGTYTIHDTDGTLVQRTVDDESALAWIESNGYDLVESVDGGIIVEPSEDEEESSDDE